MHLIIGVILLLIVHNKMNNFIIFGRNPEVIAMHKKKSDNITRKEAIKKMGKYGAITAVGTFMILNPQKAQADSPPDPGGNPFG